MPGVLLQPVPAKRIQARGMWSRLARGLGAAIAGLAGYLGAYPSTDPKRLILQGWKPREATADETLAPNLSTLVAQCRQLERSSPTARGVVEGLVAELVGSGIGVRPATGNPQLDRRLFEAFNAWAERAGAGGESLWELQAQAVREWVTAGCVLWRWVLVDNKPAILALEAEWLADHPVAECAPGSLFVRGIELDQYRRPIAYHLRNPDLSLAPRWDDGERVPADLVLHVFERRRAAQTHGEPVLSPIVETLQQEQQLTEAELRAAVNTAAISVFIATTTPFGDLDGVAGDADREPVTDIPVGSVVQGQPGEMPHILENKRPSQQIAPFAEFLRSKIASAARVSRRWLSRDTAGANYSRDRRDQLDSQRVLRPVMLWLGEGIAGKVYLRLVPWLLAGLGEFRAAGQLSAYELEADAPEDIDPSKDTDASLAAIAGGLSTYQRELGRRGLDYRQVMRQQAIEAEERRRLGLSVDEQAPVQPAGEQS